MSAADRPTSVARRAGFALAALVVFFAVAGPWLTSHGPAEQFAEAVYAPPMRPRLLIPAGTGSVTSRLRLPFVYPLRLENRLEHRYVEDRSRPMPLRLFRNGALLSVDAEHGSPWFPLGADALGRDQFARLAWATRLSLGVALGAALGAILIGALVGGLAGSAGGLLDDGLMRVADVIMALPAVYVVLALRASMPLVLTTPQVFWTMVVVLAAVGWPIPARGVRAVVAAESAREYAEAARAMGASRTQDPATSLTARGAGISHRPGEPAGARVRARGGDVVVCRAGVRRADSQLGHDVTGRRPRPGPGRRPLAPGPRRRHRLVGAGRQPHRGRWICAAIGYRIETRLVSI